MTKTVVIGFSFIYEDIHLDIQIYYKDQLLEPVLQILMITRLSPQWLLVVKRLATAVRDIKTCTKYATLKDSLAHLF